MSRLTAILKSKQKFPKPEANWNFGDFSKIQSGAGANDVAGWTGESLKTGLATVDLTQSTAAAQPVFDTDHISFDGSDYLEGMPTQTGDFSYVIKIDTTSTGIQIVLGTASGTNEAFFIANSGLRLSIRPFSGVTYNWDLSVDLSDGVTRAIILTRLGSIYTLYIDGVSQGTNSDASQFHSTRLSGWGPGTFGFMGNMYNALIFPVALTAAEVAAVTSSLS